MGKTISICLGKDISGDFPDINLAVLKAKVPVQKDLVDAIDAQAGPLSAAISDLNAFDPITTMPELAVWRTAYQKLGVKPSKFLSSIEALLRRAKKGEHAQVGIPAVDLYNIVSVIHRVPMGAYDVTKLGHDPIQLRYALPEQDVFTPLGGQSDRFPLNPKLAVYAQGNEILCWGFNTKDSAETAVDECSHTILFLSESVSIEGKAKSMMALDELSNIITGSGGTVSPIASYSASQPEGAL